MQGTTPLAKGVAVEELEVLGKALRASAAGRDALAKRGDPQAVLDALAALEGDVGKAARAYLDLVRFRTICSTPPRAAPPGPSTPSSPRLHPDTSRVARTGAAFTRTRRAPWWPALPPWWPALPPWWPALPPWWPALPPWWPALPPWWPALPPWWPALPP
ncbi:hypothetical protein [Sorangium cellulosum]|uniref:hypothetical protein n=1 Tax=Sorangium cellulosum TaxID=56 RepID=UPI000311F97B|nr:hypothetical protein [Sorangium cellulosum]